MCKHNEHCNGMYGKTDDFTLRSKNPDLPMPCSHEQLNTDGRMDT